MSKQTNNVSQFNSKEQMQEQACLWISRMDRGLTPNEQKELVIWCNQNSTHHRTLLEMASYWDDLSVLNELSGLFPLEKVSVKKLKRPQKWIKVAVAASIALLSVFGTNLLVKHSFLPFVPSLHEQALTQTETLISPMGQQKTFTMSDGTHIQLNTDSILNVTYTANYRHLTLVKGEAQFNVAKDKSRPFTVISGDKSFTALGTIFNVQKNDNDKMELMVTEGRVLISKATEKLSVIKQTLLNTNENTPAKDLPGILVTSGEKAVIEHDLALPVQKISLDQVQRDLAWQQGMLIFDGEPLENALNEISRYSTHHFKIIDPRIAKVKVSGYFRANDIDGLLSSLNSNFNINFQKNIDHSIVLSYGELH